MIAVVTSVFGGYDWVRPAVTQTVDADWVVVTDDVDLEVPAPWRTIYTPLGLGEHPRMGAVRVRTGPWEWVPQADAVISVDANMRVTSRTFVADMVAAAPSGLAMLAHPRRDCIYDEATASVREAPAKWRDAGLDAQVDAYRREGHPRRWGLWAAGVVVIDCTNVAVRAVLADWRTECERWSAQTQVSLPVVCRRHDLRPDTLPGGQRLGEPWLTIESHIGRT